MLAIRKAGAILVSTSEQIDETPSGMLMHGIMASMAEFYSRNLANEAKKGIAQKAKNGGTHGFAPVGYHNTLARIDGRDVKGVAIDKERAPHIRWAFDAYATGEWSISQLRDALEDRGFKSRPTRVWEGKPPSRAQVHRMLTNPYYAGRIVHCGVLFDGAHEPLVDEVTWFRVQELLAKRKVAGERSWRHSHYLKGTLVCNRCGGKMGFGYAHGKGGTYAYFFCLGRHTGRTDCDLPYVSVELAEEAVQELWAERQFEPETVDYIRATCLTEFDELQKRDRVLLQSQKNRLSKLLRQKDKLIDAYLDDAIPKEDMKRRQAGILAEIADAERIIQDSEQDMTVVREHLELLLILFENAEELYRTAPGPARQALNQAIFSLIRIDLKDEDPGNRGRQCHASGELTPPAASVVSVALDANSSPHAGTRGLESEDMKGTPDLISQTEGSNVIHMAEREGFEPS